MSPRSTPTIRGNLLVVDRQEGPTYYAKWRDSSRRQVKRRLGPAWVERDGQGGWRKRRGRCPEDHLDERSAYAELQRVIDLHEDTVARDARRAARIKEAGLPVREAAEAWLDHGLNEREWKHSTYGDYRDVVAKICRSLGNRRADAVTREDLERFISELRPERNGEVLDRLPSPRMKTKYVLVLRAIFAHATELGWVDESPAVGLKVKGRRYASKNHPLRREEYLIPEEVHAVVREATARNASDGALVLTLAFAGLRLGEALALRWQDVDFERSSLRVIDNWTRGRTGTPKGGGGRTVPMADEVAQVLAQLGQRELATAPQDLVFITPQGTHVDTNAFRKRFYKAQERAEVTPRRTLHQLRHTFATVCVSAGVPLRTVQGWCGHEHYATTERYAHFLPRHEDAALVSAAFRTTTVQASAPAT